MKRSYLYASIWYCDDPVCDCYQPRVERFSPNPDFRGAWRIKELWSGSFFSQPSAEDRWTMEEELRTAAREHGIELNEHLTGNRDL